METITESDPEVLEGVTKVGSEAVVAGSGSVRVPPKYKRTLSHVRLAVPRLLPLQADQRVTREAHSLK